MTVLLVLLTYANTLDRAHHHFELGTFLNIDVTTMTSDMPHQIA